MINNDNILLIAVGRPGNLNQAGREVLCSGMFRMFMFWSTGYKIARHSILTTKKPLQASLHGSRYKFPPCLPQEEFNSGVRSGAAAITKNRSFNSSPRATLRGEFVHPGYITRSGQNGSSSIAMSKGKPATGHKYLEGLPM